jgi:tetratricopeptide (TPR) repeat protein
VAYTSEIEKLEARYRENPKGRNFAPLADAYRKAGLIDNAIELCQAGLQLHGDYVSGHIVHGRCLVDKKDDAGAEQVFRRVLDLDPENILALKVLAEIAERNDRFDQAAEWLNRLLLADPMNGEAADGLSRVRTKAAATPTQPTPAVVEPVAKLVTPSEVEAPVQVEHEELEIGADSSARPPRLSIEYMEGPFSADLAEAPTAAITQPDFELERTSEPPPSAEATAEVQGYDGGVDFKAAAAEATAPEGIQFDEPIIAAPEPGVVVEGLARTQYAGSGVFKIDDEVDPEVRARPAADLPLIMPDDVAPAAPQPEMPVVTGRAPAPPLRLPDDDGAADATALAQAEPVLTETMAELYLRQGHRDEARRVYEALAAQRPLDERLHEKVAELSAPKPRHLGSGQSAAAYLKGILSARPGAPAPPPLKAPEPAPLSAGSAPVTDLVAPPVGEGQPAPPAPGTPTRPASDAISLDSVFGDEGNRGSMPSIPAFSGQEPGKPSKLPPASGGFSFDDFFGTSAPPASGIGKGPAPSARPPRPAGRSRSPEQEEDLDQFQAWLKSLKA